MIRKSFGLWLVLITSAAGCASLSDQINEYETRMRNSVLAYKAWSEWSWCYDSVEYPSDFARGFREGYTDILAGGNGCQPTLPPRSYWKPCYQTLDGHCRIAAWFDGFSHGALTARQDGYGSMHLPISPTARANLMSKYATPNPACFDELGHGPLPTADPQAPGMIPEAGPMEMIPGPIPKGTPGRYDDSEDELPGPLEDKATDADEMTEFEIP